MLKICWQLAGDGSPVTENCQMARHSKQSKLNTYKFHNIEKRKNFRVRISTYLPTYAYPPIYLSAYLLSIYQLIYLPTYLSTSYLPMPMPTYLCAYLLSFTAKLWYGVVLRTSHLSTRTICNFTVGTRQT